MGVTKKNLFTPEQNKLAQIAKSLAHPARIAILQYLLKINSCVNGELVGELGLAQATISQHLKELKNVGIIQGTIEGTSISYCINPTVWLQIKETLNNLFEQHGCCSSKGDCC